MIGNGHLLFKKKKTDLDEVHRSLKEKYGSVYKTVLFGESFLNIHNPKDIKTLLALDGAKPIIPGFDNFTKLRKSHQKEYLGGSAGLVTQGEEWFNFRQGV